MHTAVYWLTAQLSFACSVSCFQGGVTAPKKRFGWMVSIKNEVHHHVCGGILIHPSYILTAAHCVDNRTNVRHNAIVYVGQHSLEDDENTDGVEVSLM